MSAFQEFERQLAAKEASLPQEPTSNDDSAVTLLVKMPDGSRRGRRFLKSDKLQVNCQRTKCSLLHSIFTLFLLILIVQACDFPNVEPL